MYGDGEAKQKKQIHFLNILEKCTQILRDDRITLRNELKARNPDLLTLFLKSKQPINLQHLQVQLRKYLTVQKNYKKSMQLSKFKAHLTQATKSKSIGFSYQNSKNSFLNFEKNAVSEKLQNMNCSFKPNASCQKYDSRRDIPQTAKNQRVSLKENQFYFEDGFHEKLQEAKGPKQSANIRFQSGNLQLQLGKRAQQNKHQKEQKSEKKKNMQKRSCYQKRQQMDFDMPEREPACSRPHYEDSRLSQKYFSNDCNSNIYSAEGSLNSTAKISNYEMSSHKNSFREFSSEIPDPSLNPLNISAQEHLHIYSNNQNLDSKQAQTNGYPKQGNSKEQRLLPPSLSNLPQVQFGNDESIFTPPRLLLECRNFLKDKLSQRGCENPKITEENTPYLEEKHNPANFSKPLLNSTTAFTSTFNNLQQEPKFSFGTSSLSSNIEEENKLTHQIPQKQTKFFNTFEPYSLKNQASQSLYCNNQTNHKGLEQSNKKNYCQLNNQVKEKYKNMADKQRNEELRKREQISQKAQDGLGELIFYIYQKNHENMLISYQKLCEIVNDELFPYEQDVRALFEEWMSSKSNQIHCLPDIAKAICEHVEDGTPCDQDVNQIYTILDIEKKGFVDHADIESFISQLEEAQVDCLQELESNLQKLFQQADAKHTGQITYWHLYLSKKSEHFIKVHQMLSDFQFSVE